MWTGSRQRFPCRPKKFADQVDSTSQALDFVASKAGRPTVYDVVDTNWGDLDDEAMCWPEEAVQYLGEFA
jgi:hypothetical protein